MANGSHQKLHFLIDEDTDVRVRGLLEKHGHEVTISRDRLPKGAVDSLVAELAGELQAIVVTRNRKDYQRLLKREPDDGKEKPFDRFPLITFQKVPGPFTLRRLEEALPYIHLAAQQATPDKPLRVLIEMQRVCVY